MPNTLPTNGRNIQPNQDYRTSKPHTVYRITFEKPGARLQLTISEADAAAAIARAGIRIGTTYPEPTAWRLADIEWV